MPFNGAGTFTGLPPPDYPAVAGNTIKASEFNANMADVFLGLSNTLTRDGQSPPTADLPMASRRFTGVGDATLPDQFVSLNQLSGTGVGQGAVLVAVRDTMAWFSAVATKTVETVLGWIGSWIDGQPINVMQYMSVSQIASIKAYNFSVEVSTEVQQALDDGWAARKDVFAPAGGYKIDAASLVLPGTRPTPETRARTLRFYGQGYGNPFSSLNNGGTIFKSTANRPILTDNNPPTLPDWSGVIITTPPSPDAQGTFTIDHMRFDGSSTTPVVLLNTASGIGEYHHFVIYQRSTGDGLYVGYGATVHFHDFYTYNSNFVATGLGAARTGVGVNFPNSYGAGLVTFSKCSSRGWHDGYIIGRAVAYPEAIAAGKQVTAFHTTLRDFEVSTCFNGVTLQAQTSNCTVDEGYFEGMEDGVCITDNGVFNQITHNQMFAGFSKGIVLGSGSGYGGVCAWNEIATVSRANTTLIEANMNLGLGRSVVDNTLIFGASGTGVVGVVGIDIIGANTQLNLSGNMFNPKIAWSGGAGTMEIRDGSTGVGMFGFGFARFSSMHVPALNLGAISIALDSTTVTDVVPSGVTGTATLSAASDFLITFATPKTITGFTGLKEGQVFWLRITNGNCTLNNTATLKLESGITYTPGVNGASMQFKVHSGIAWEQSRTAY